MDDFLDGVNDCRRALRLLMSMHSFNIVYQSIVTIISRQIARTRAHDADTLTTQNKSKAAQNLLDDRNIFGEQKNA